MIATPHPTPPTTSSTKTQTCPGGHRDISHDGKIIKNGQTHEIYDPELNLTEVNYTQSICPTRALVKESNQQEKKVPRKRREPTLD